MDTQEIRAFIAVELPDEVTSGLHRLQAELKSAGHTFVKWVAPGGIHLTLKFLGNVSSKKVAEITRAMEEACHEGASFQLEIGGLGAFPDLKRPRVLWLGIGGDVDKLVALQQRIDAALGPLGFAQEGRPFTPHLTLARLREETSPQCRRDFGELVIKTTFEFNHTISVSSLSLMRSRLLPGGAAYSRLAEVKLKSINDIIPE